MHSLKVSDILFVKYEITKVLFQNIEGDFYEVKDIEKNKIYDLQYSLIEKDSPFLLNFDKYGNYLKNSANTMRDSDLILPIFSEQRPNTSRKPYEINQIHIYNKGSFERPLFNKIGWDEDKYCSNTIMSDPDIQKIFEDIFGDLTSLNKNGFHHSFICPESIFFYESRYRLAFPGFSNLIENISLTYKTVTKGFRELNIFPLAPELIKNKMNLSEKADVWSLGILLSILKTGKLPFNFSTQAGYLSAIKAGELTLKIEESMGNSYKTLLSGALKLDPYQRFSLNDFSEKLKTIFNPVVQSNNIEITGVSLNNENEIKRWFENVFQSEHVELQNHGDIVRGRLKISPFLLPSQTQNKVLTISVNSPSIQGTKSKERKEITIYPSPQIRIVNTSYLMKKYDSAFQGSSYHYEGRIDFRIIQSVVRISKINIDIEGIPNPIDEIEFNGLNTLLTPNPGGEPYYIYFKVVDADIKINEVSRLILNFSLHNHSSIEHTHPIIPTFPAKLDILFDIMSQLRLHCGELKTFTLELRNSGGNPCRITNIYLRYSRDLIRLFFKPTSRWISNNQQIEFQITVDGTSVRENDASQGEFVIEYDEQIQSKILSNKCNHKFNLVFKKLDAESVIAIDFGTSNTCAAYIDADGEYNLVNWSYNIGAEEDYKSLPSFLYYSDKKGVDEIYYGQEAKTSFLQGRPNTFHSVKRFIGEHKSEPVFIHGHPRFVTYEEMTFDYLSKLFNDISIYNERRFTKYIFTHPTNITRAQELAYKDIINRLHINDITAKIKFIDEATAGALHFINQRAESDSYYLVYDFGGGTTDIVLAFFECYNIKTPGGFTKHKKLTPLFATGYNYGGDTINELIIEEIVNIIYEKEAKLIPAIPMRERGSLPGNWSDELRSRVSGNYAKLWDKAESFKKSIDLIKDSDTLTISLIYCLTNSSTRDQYTTYLVEPNPSSVELDYTSLCDLRKIVFKKVGERLDKIIKEVLSYSNKTIENSKPINILLLGRSSNLKLVQHLFEYYVNNTSFPQDQYDGFYPSDSPLFFNSNSTVEKPDELKQVVALGAIQMENQDIETCNDRFYNTIIAWGIEIILPGRVKIDDKNPSKIVSILQNGTHNEYACYVSTKNSLKFYHDKSYEFREQSPRLRSSLGYINIKIDKKYIDLEGYLCVYVNSQNQVRSVIIDEDWRILQYEDIQR
ncbi:MAG: Hsp70 family protein [Ignavibacteriales bacterium]|nr:Hsp70 family protein [Ignavibacteriales bacterium]